MSANNISAGIKKLARLITETETILVLQPERPDTDSLCSALALEQILGDLDKKVVLYSKDTLPPYINYFEGADRLVDELPGQFDLTILVDAGGPSQIGRTLEKYQGRLAAKPFVILDHHSSREPFPFDTITIAPSGVSATGQLIATLAQKLDWPINRQAASLIVPAIMADTLGLTNALTTAEAIETVAAMVRLGADMYHINQARLAAGALTPTLLRLRARLLGEVEFLLDDQLALLIVNPDTLKQYAKEYDPAALVFYDIQHVRDVRVAAVIKHYGPKVKLSLRANEPIAATIAAQFGGGGHDYAAAAGIEGGSAADIRAKVIEETRKLLTHATL